MHQFFEFGFDGRFEGRHVWWLGKVQRQNDRSAGSRDRIEQLIFLACTAKDRLQAELACKRISSERVLLIQGIKHHWLTSLNVLLNRFQGRVGFWFR